MLSDNNSATLNSTGAPALDTPHGEFAAKDAGTTDGHRSDVDGLRAIAVIAVIVFHLAPQSLPGGYLGVDVFFVISGFLITSNILKQIETSTFGFRTFWIRRIKRLFPAMAAVLITSLCLGYFILFGDEWKSLAYQTISVLCGSSNIWMWRTANNYWGEAATSMPLLHTWSLGVEEQFYVLFPMVLFVLLAVMKLSRRSRLASLVTMLIASLALWVLGTQLFPSAAFYLLPTRAWQILLGSVLATGTFGTQFLTARWRRSIAGIGFGCIVVSLFAVWESHLSRNIGAIASCLGTAGVLRYGSSGKGITGRVLTFPVAVFLGKISYSWYLWHWPVIVFSKHLGLYSSLLQFVASLLLGTVSYFWIERPTRYLPNPKFFKLFAALFAFLVLSTAMPFWVKRRGIEYALPTFYSSINLEPLYDLGTFEGFKGNYQEGLILADVRNIEKLDVLLIGDSHSLMFFPAIKSACDARNLTLGFYGADGGTAPFFVDEDNPADFHAGGWSAEQRVEFDKFRRTFLNRFRPTRIFVCGNWASYLSRFGPDRFDMKVKNLIDSSRDSTWLFVGQPPVLPFGSGGFQSGMLDVPRWRAFTEDKQSNSARISANKLLLEFSNTLPRCRFVKTEDRFSGRTGIRFIDGEHLFYKDDDHLSVDGAMRCRDLFLHELSAETASKQLLH